MLCNGIKGSTGAERSPGVWNGWPGVERAAGQLAWGCLRARGCPGPFLDVGCVHSPVPALGLPLFPAWEGAEGPRPALRGQAVPGSKIPERRACALTACDTEDGRATLP